MQPITELHSSYRTVRKSGVRWGYRQTRPYNLNLPYYADHLTDGSAEPWESYEGWGWGNDKQDFWRFTSLNQDTYNRAYGKFKDQLGEASQIGATLTAEGRETSKLLASTVLKILGSARMAATGRFMDAFRILGYPVAERTITVDRRNRSSRRRKNRRLKVRMRVWKLPNTGRYYTKTAANGWLLWSYAVKPLTSDIYNSLDVLGRALPHHRVVGSASATGQMSTNDPMKMNGMSFRSATFGHRISADVLVLDSQRWLLNQWGLTNPAQWVLEGIRLSFVLDWFSNLSEVVASWMDFTGLDITDIVHTMKAHLEESGVFPEWDGNAYVDRVLSHSRRRIWRDLPGNIAPPKLIIQWERVHWQRGLNAISLLIGVIKSGPYFKNRN